MRLLLGEELRADRVRAMPRVAYETLGRHSELVGLEVRDIETALARR